MNERRALDPPGALPVFGYYRSDGAERFDSYIRLSLPMFGDEMEGGTAIG